MKKVSLAILVSLSTLTGAAFAQQDKGLTMSTDPAKAADVEQRAQDLQAKQQAMESAPARPMKHHKGALHHKKAAPSEAASAAGTDIGSQPGHDTPADTGFDVTMPRKKN